MECDGCIKDNAEVEITLEEGDVFYACLDCIPLVIKENAYTDNPVHSIAKIEGD